MRATVLLLCAAFAMHIVAGAVLKPSDLPKAAASKAKVIRFASGQIAGGLAKINPFLTAANLKNISNGAACADRKPWEGCNQYVSMFNGLSILNKEKGFTFLGLSGHSPAVIECADFAEEAEDGDAEWQAALDTFVNPASVDANGLGFPVAKFAPAFFKVQYEKSTNKLAVGASCYLKKTNGQPINGLPNFKGRDLPAFGGICSGKQLAYSQSGLDTEGIQVIPGRKHVAIVDEYAPSIVIARSFNYGSSCGQIVARYVPTDSKLSSAEAGYPIIKVLPAILSQRREDRSFGALSVSSNGKYLLASNQGPMGKEDDYENSHVITAVRLDISSLTKPKFLGLHLYLADRAEEGKKQTWAKEDMEATDIKLAAMADAAPTLGLKKGTPVVVAVERASDQFRIYLVDFSKSTNVWGKYGGDPLKFEKLGGYDASVAALKKAGIKTAKKVLLLDSGLIEDGESAANILNFRSVDKQEGIAILNNCVVAVGTDNDFGLDDDPSNFSVIQLSKCIKTAWRQM